MINLTSFAVSRDILRSNMSGLYFKIEQNLFTMAGASSTTLALIKMTSETDNIDGDILIPIKSIEQIKKILKATIDNNIVIKYNNSAIEIQAGQFVIQSKLVNERFPDYEQVIPRENDKVLIVDRNILKAVLKRVGVLANPISNLVKFDLSDNKLIVSSEDFDTGTQASEIINVDYDSEDITIGFSSRVILDAIEHIGFEDVEISMKNTSGATLIKPCTQPDNQDYMVIAMPLRLVNEGE